MRTIPKRILLASLLSFFALLVACATVDGLYVDPSFTFASMARNNLGVAGVSSVVQTLSVRQSSSVANILLNQLNDKYPQMGVMPMGDTVRALGAGRYRQMMRYYEDNDVVQDVYLQALRRHISGMRYLVFARIDEDNIQQHREQDDDFVTDGTDDRNQMSQIQYQTIRTVRISLEVYDLQLNRVVWRGSTEQKRSTHNDYDIPATQSGLSTRAIVSNLVSAAGQAMVEKQHEYPSPPSLSQMAGLCFETLLRKFPMPVQQ